MAPYGSTTVWAQRTTVTNKKRQRRKRKKRAKPKSTSISSQDTGGTGWSISAVRCSRDCLCWQSIKDPIELVSYSLHQCWTDGSPRGNWDVVHPTYDIVSLTFSQTPLVELGQGNPSGKCEVSVFVWVFLTGDLHCTLANWIPEYESACLQRIKPHHPD